MSQPVHLILSPGTHIVTGSDANRSGGGQLIAAGAVPVITNSPVDAQHAYKVRCNDGAVRLDEERDALLTIKRGERPWPDVNAWRLRPHKQFDEAFASTQLPDLPDSNWANEFLLKARRHRTKAAYG